ncbi:MAG: YqgE/AlgH family protein [Bacteroidetes bacterium]|nr:YqgE/AlgH family protein [Bacteroidota bacterium]
MIFLSLKFPLLWWSSGDRYVVLHPHSRTSLEGSKEILNGIFWGGDYDQLKFLIDTKQIRPDQIRFYAGYSGWEPKQLDHEMKEKSWLVFKANMEFTFANNPRSLWSEVLRSMGNEYAILANFPEDPNLN